MLIAWPCSVSAWPATMRRGWRHSRNGSKLWSPGAAATASSTISTTGACICSRCARRLLGGVSHEEARRQLKDFTMAGIAKNITCPTLITHGDKDTLMSVEGAKRLFEEIGAKDKTLKIYGEADGGGRIHCSHDYWAHNLPYMLDWLEERL